jgi:hypothetical protein
MWMDMLTKRCLLTALVALGLLIPAFAQTTIFNCSSFTSSGACAAVVAGYGTESFIIRNGGSLSGSQVDFVPANSGHNGYGMSYYAPVNIQAFTTTFTFVPNGENISFVVQNTTDQPGYQGNIFSSGAGCEAGIYQAFTQPPALVSPNNLFALELDSGGWLTEASGGFTYSSAQIYQQNESPCVPNDNGPDYYPINKVSTAPVALNSPAGTQFSTTGDVYSATVTYTGTNLALSMYDVTTGGSCPGNNCFTHLWPVSIPTEVDGATAYVGFAAGVNIPNLPALYIDSWRYTVLSAASTPTLSPISGTYSGAQSVMISNASTGAVICYNTTGGPATDGTTGCANGTLYTGAFSVASGETVFAVAGGTDYGDSAIGSAAYKIGSTASQPTFSPASGSYSGSQTVTLRASTGSIICYNTTGSPATNGFTGCSAGTLYTTPITVSSNETVYAVSGGAGLIDSAIGSAAYVLNGNGAASPTYSPLPGTYTGTQNITLASTTVNSYICYLLASSPPALSPQADNAGGCAVGTLYSGPVSVSSSQTLYAMAGTIYSTPPSSLTSGSYTITSASSVANPTFSAAAGTYSGPLSVMISDGTPGATIFYTTDGNTPTTSSIAYAGPITVSSTETLEAMASATGYANSAVVSAAYNIADPVVSTPDFSSGAGTYSSAQTVTISDATSGATIYYTTNGITPTTSSTAYTGPVTVSSTETLEAIALAPGYTNSAVASAVYTISMPLVVTPAFFPAAGTYSSGQAVTISDATSGASIYYTTNGTIPTTSSAIYSGPITVNATETVQAIAAAPGDTNSGVAYAAYTISSSAQQPTNFAIGTTVQQSPVKHLGINIGGQSFYDSGQLSRNLTVRNPGFEAEVWSSILNCQAATASTCTDSDPTNVWPANFLQGATFQVIYGAAKGQSGTIEASTPANSSANGGITFTFSAPLSPAPAPGDVIQVRMQVSGNPQAGWWVSASGGATFSPDTTDLSPGTPGKQALAINAAGNGQSASVNSYFDSYNGRSFVQLNGAYTLTFRAKAVSGSNQINVSFGRLTTPAHGNVTYLNQSVTLTNQWKDYSYTFNAAEDGTYVGTAALTFSIQGAQVYLDDVALTEPAAADNPTAFRNAVVNTLKSLQPGVLRFMDGGADFASTTDNMIGVPFARLRAGYGERQTEQDDISIGLHDFLVLCQTVGAEPWYTVPAGISAADMQNLIQYLAGDASTPYGAIRASLGQSTPWTSVFTTIHLELGNEMWNSTFAGEAIPNPAAYGNVATAAFAAARAASSYDASKFDLVMGSWAVDPNWTAQELQNSSGYDSVAAAPYLFNNVNDYGTIEAIFGPMFAQPEQVDSSPTANGNYMYQQAQAAAAGNPPAKLSVYEVNLSTTSGTAPQNIVNQVAAGLGAGIAAADHMLLMMRDLGITTQNMFALPEYANGFNNSQGGTEAVPLWGSVVDMGGETNLKRPQFFALQLANSAILPTMLATIVSGDNPTWNQVLSTNDSIQLANAHYLQSFAFTDGTQKSVVVFNLSRNQSQQVTFSGINAPSGNVVISQLTSTNPTDNNEGLFTNSPVVAAPTQANVSNFNPATPYTLPPYSMTVFRAGSALAASTTTLQVSPTSANAGQSVTLTATVSSQSGTDTPTGTVVFYNGSTSLGAATLGLTGIATLSTTTLPAGSNSITASFGGDAYDSGSTSQPVIVTITSALVPTNTVLATSTTAISPGQSVTLTATVFPQMGSNVATGTVTFFDGATSLGTAPLNGSGVAMFITTLAAGTQSITASYGGDGSDRSSVSQVISIVVAQGAVPTKTTLIASATQVITGQSVKLTARVTPQSGSNLATGTVTFLEATTSLGTAQLDPSGAATLSTASLAVGTHMISASYGGDGKDISSVSSIVSVTVTAAHGLLATTTTLSASSTQVLPLQGITLTAAVVPQFGSNVPTGTVTFLDGSNSLGVAQLSASGGATLGLASLPVGTNSISASYGGDANDSASTSAAITVDVSTPEYALVVSTSSVNLTPGQRSTLAVTLIPENGFNLPITLTCSGLPQGANCAFDPSTVTPSGTPVMSTVTITAPAMMAQEWRHAPRGARGGQLVFAWVMPWGFIPLLGFAKTRRGSRIGRWLFRLTLTAALVAGSLWVSGCGYSANRVAFVVTITASAPNAQTHTSQITVNLQ